MQIGNSRGIRIPKPIFDQLRTIYKSRLIKKLGSIDPQTQVEVIATLQRLFAF